MHLLAAARLSRRRSTSVFSAVGRASSPRKSVARRKLKFSLSYMHLVEIHRFIFWPNVPNRRYAPFASAGATCNPTRADDARGTPRMLDQGPPSRPVVLVVEDEMVLRMRAVDIVEDA